MIDAFRQGRVLPTRSFNCRANFNLLFQKEFEICRKRNRFRLTVVSLHNVRKCFRPRYEVGGPDPTIHLPNNDIARWSKFLRRAAFFPAMTAPGCLVAS
jgi:hypothetical protein